MKMRSRRREGFTLVELLVVIAIIAVLVAILMPVIGSVQEKARQARCLSNVMQIVTALRQFKTDHGYYPPAPYYDAGAGIYRGGVSDLYPDYIPNKSVLICPDDAPNLRGIPESAIPRNYSSYNGQIAASGDPVTSPATYWALATFTDPDGWSYTRYRVTYNYGGFDNEGWDETSWDAGGNPVFKTPEGGSLPAWLAAEGKKWRHYPRLGNRRAPDNTIVIRCIHHHKWYGTAEHKWRDPIVRLGGDSETVDYKPWTLLDPTTGASQWKVQK